MLDPVGHYPKPEKPIPFRRAVTSSPRLELATQVLTGLARNYPRPRQRGSGADGCENGAEDSGPGRQARGVDHGAHGGFALGRPHGPVAVGDLALNDGRSQGALAGIVRDLDPTRMIQEGQE